MDGLELLLGSASGAAEDAAPGSAAAHPFAASGALPAPATQDEIDAIVAAVPRACRTNARWAVPLLLNSARSGGITHVRRIAYVLATAQYEAQFGAELEERGGVPGRDGCDRAFAHYEPGTPLGATLGNVAPGDGERFRGRGFVHVKGRASYATWSQRLGMPDQLIEDRRVPYFVAYPAALAQPAVAAQTLVRGMRDGLFTGIPLGSFVNDKKTDFYNARRVVDAGGGAREIAETALAFAHAIEELQNDRHREHMAKLADRHAAGPASRNLVADVGEAVVRLAQRGEVMPCPVRVVDWNGEARQGKFVQLDGDTCALHIGRGVYIRLSVQRDLNGVVPPEARNMALKRSGEVRLAVRHGDVNFWR